LDKEKRGKPKGRRTGVVFNIAIAVLFFAVIGLTAANIALLTMSAASEGDVPLRMEQLTADSGQNRIDTGGYLVPSFIGFRAGREQVGISAGYNTVYDLYAWLFPVLTDVLTDGFEEVPADRWQKAAAEKTFVYVKYHSPVPYQLIHAFAGGESESYADALNIYELFILPDSGFRILARTAAGTVYEFGGTYESYFIAEDLSELIRSYRRSVTPFVFTGDSAQDPQFTDRIRTRNIVISENSASVIRERRSDMESLLLLMDFNPDKLYTHEESDTGYVFVENHGVLRILDEGMEYTAASYDGGIAVSKMLGYYDSGEYTVSDYINASCLILNRVKSLNTAYIGGDAEIVLDSAESGSDGSVTFRFIYTFDNLRIAGCDPAFVIRFRSGAVMELHLYSVSARHQGEQYDSLLEAWYYEAAQANVPENAGIADVRLVYRAAFPEKPVAAEWSAVYRERLPDGKTE